VNEWEWQLLEDKKPLDQVEIGGTTVRVGDRVRLRPRRGGDVIDLALSGQIATIEALEQDYEGKVHVCVVLDDDPGRDLGLLRQPGHRFFFDVAEVEPLPPEQQVQKRPAARPRVLIAGIGNIFMGDDAFGVEVVRRLATQTLPPDVRVNDFGIRGFDLAYALQDGCETTILVDACPRGEEPGTLYVVEPDLSSLGAKQAEGGDLDAHSLDPVKILRLAAAMGGQLKRVLLVGCEPMTLGPEEGAMGLSEPVERAVSEAVTLLDSLVRRVLSGDWPGSQEHTAA
jgi:hydrogenase maturation protease